MPNFVNKVAICKLSCHTQSEIVKVCASFLPVLDCWSPEDMSLALTWLDYPLFLQVRGLGLSFQVFVFGLNLESQVKLASCKSLKI